MAVQFYYQGAPRAKQVLSEHQDHRAELLPLESYNELAEAGLMLSTETERAELERIDLTITSAPAPRALTPTESVMLHR